MSDEPAGLEVDDDSIAEHAMYYPPWREVRPNGSFGPWYGPRTAGALQLATEAYHERPGGDAFWDRTQTLTYRRRTLDDEGTVRAYVESPVTRPAARELEVYAAVYLDHKTAGQAAILLGLQVATVRNLLNRLRLQARCYTSAR